MTSSMRRSTKHDLLLYDCSDSIVQMLRFLPNVDAYTHLGGKYQRIIIKNNQRPSAVRGNELLYGC